MDNPEVTEGRTPVTDLSRRAVSLARIIDRLPEGYFTILLKKYSSRWAVEVRELKDGQDLELRG